MAVSTQYASADQIQLIAQANRRMAEERKRQAGGGDQATEAGAVALAYAEKEVRRLYKDNADAEKLTLKGETDPKRIQQIIEAAERIVSSKQLTVAGRKEINIKMMETFFDVKRGEFTKKHYNIWRALTTPGPDGIAPIQRVNEMVNYDAGSIKDAAQQMSAAGMSSDEIVNTLDDYLKENAGKRQPSSVYDYLEEKYPDMTWSR